MSEEKIVDKNNNNIDDQFEFDERQWKTRKDFAKTCLKAAIILVFGVVFGAIAFPAVGQNVLPVIDVVAWGLMGMFSIVGGFLGIQTWWDLKRSPATTKAKPKTPTEGD